MPLPVLVRVAFIPLKSGAGVQRVFSFRHSLSIYLAYTRCKLDALLKSYGMPSVFPALSSASRWGGRAGNSWGNP